MRRLLASRGLLSALTVLAAAGVVLVGYLVVAEPLRATERYCAHLPDAIGLYPGSHVRLRGVVVGTVAAVGPETTTVRVDFDLDARYAPHGDLAAATVADTLAADRDLTVLPGPSSAPRWDPNRCITRTLTPRSITETLRATNDLAHRLGTTDDPRLIHDTIDALRDATTGAGPQFDRLTRSLGSALRSPDTEISQVGSLIDALSSLAASVSANWNELRDVLTRFPDVFEQINNEIFAHLAELVDSLRIILPWVDEITRQYGGAILGGLDAAVPYVRVLAAGADTLEQILARIPALAGAFARATNPAGEPVITWAPPKVAVPQPLSGQICAAINAVVPGRCGDDTLDTVDLATLVLGSAAPR